MPDTSKEFLTMDNSYLFQILSEPNSRTLCKVKSYALILSILLYNENQEFAVCQTFMMELFRKNI